MEPDKIARLKADLEWDGFAEGAPPADIKTFGPLQEPIGTVTTSRTETYELAAAVRSTRVDGQFRELYADLQAGDISHGHALDARTPNSTLLLDGVLVNTSSTTYSTTSQAQSTSQLHALKATRLTHSSEKPALLAEWYLGGPSPMFPRVTQREYAFQLTRRRHPKQGDPSSWPEITKPQPSQRPDGTSSRDHLLLTPGDGVTAVLAKVPSTFGPEWSNNVTIEYDGVAPPSDDVRKGVAEGVGLFFGRQLLCVGDSTFDAHGFPLQQRGWSPPVRDARQEASRPDAPLFACDPRQLEAELNRFVSAYLRQRSELDLSKTAQTLWVASRLPLGPDLAIYAAALERLMNAWFRSTRSKSQGVYMPKREFDQLLNDELTAISAKLQSHEYGERIVRRMSGTFAMGANERLNHFFSELGLGLSAHELEAMKARNKSAHGSDESEVQHAFQLTRTYRTLVNRVLLRVLGHSDHYTNYAASGFPEVKMDTPGGPTSDAG